LISLAAASERVIMVFDAPMGIREFVALLYSAVVPSGKRERGPLFGIFVATGI